MWGQPDEPKERKTVLKAHLFLWQQLYWYEIFLVKFFTRAHLCVFNVYHLGSQTYSTGLIKKTFWAFQNLLYLFSTVFPYEYYFIPIVNLTQVWHQATLTSILMVRIAKIHFNKKNKKIFFQKIFKNFKKHVQNDSELM